MKAARYAHVIAQHGISKCVRINSRTLKNHVDDVCWGEIKLENKNYCLVVNEKSIWYRSNFWFLLCHFLLIELLEFEGIHTAAYILVQTKISILNFHSSLLNENVCKHILSSLPRQPWPQKMSSRIFLILSLETHHFINSFICFKKIKATKGSEHKKVTKKHMMENCCCDNLFIISIYPSIPLSVCLSVQC